jgi:hypothetical protein
MSFGAIHHQGVFGHTQVDQTLWVAFRIHVLHNSRDSVEATRELLSDGTINKPGIDN